MRVWIFRLERSVALEFGCGAWRIIRAGCGESGQRKRERDAEKGESFRMQCDRAELDVETNDFTATGNVKGITGDGQRYSAPWVRYEHASSMLLTDAPVTVVDGGITFRGDGFRYHIEERRFELLGNVVMEQAN